MVAQSLKHVLSSSHAVWKAGFDRRGVGRHGAGADLTCKRGVAVAVQAGEDRLASLSLVLPAPSFCWRPEFVIPTP